MGTGTEGRSMTAYRVTQEVRVLETVSESAESTAVRRAASDLSERVGRLEDDVEIEVGDAEVAEHPPGPFDPFRVAVRLSVGTTVDADDEASAREAGTDRIRAALDALGEPWEVDGEATASAA